jgi:hypothetical protein
MKLHHVGIIVRSISDYEKNFLYEKKLDEVVDPIQNAKLALYTSFSETLIELIEPLNENSLLWGVLNKRGTHINHLCYAHNDIDEIMEISKKLGYLKILGPVKAALFKNKDVIFFYTKNKEIIEFLVEDKEGKDEGQSN